MRRALSTRLFLEKRLTPAILDRIARAGIEAVELHCDRRHFDYRDRAQVEELRRWIPDSPLDALSLRAPVHRDPSRSLDSVIRITARDKAERIRATDEIKRALEIGDLIPCRFFVLSLGGPDENFDMHKIDSAFNALDELRVFARPLGIEILLENGASEMAAAEKLSLFLRMTHLPLGYCYDAAAAQEAGDLEGEFETMRSRIRLLHLADLGDKKRLPPLVGEDEPAIDWEAAAELFRGLDRPPEIVLDAQDPETAGDPLDPARESLDRLENLLDG